MAVHEVYQQDIWTKYIFKTPNGEFVDYEVISNNQIPQEVYDSIEEARQIAEGRARSKAYDTLQDLVQQLNSTPITEFKVADNIYVYQTDVPDYWVGQVNSTLVEYTYVDDATTIEYIKSKGQIGYYVLGILETEKVEYSANYNDLENKPTLNSKVIQGNLTTADFGIKDGKDALVINIKYTNAGGTNTTPVVDTMYGWYGDQTKIFNRTPIVGDTFLGIFENTETKKTYMTINEVTDIVGT